MSREEAKGKSVTTPTSTSASTSASSARPAVSLTKEEEAEFREIFNLVDHDGGGTISKAELGSLMHTLNLSVTPRELDIMVDEIDQNNDGEIQFEEFVAVMARKARVSYSAEDVKRAFKVFENPQHNSPGHVDVELIERALKIYSSDRLSEPQIKELLKQFRLFAKGGKFVNYIEFVQMLTGE